MRILLCGLMGLLWMSEGQLFASTPTPPDAPLTALLRDAETKDTGERDPQGAIKIYKQVIEQGADDNPLVSKAWLQMGLCYERLGKNAEALAAYQKASSLTAPTDIRTSAEKAAQLLQNKKTITHTSDTRFRSFHPWKSMTPFVQLEYYSPGNAFNYSNAELLSYTSDVISRNSGALEANNSATPGSGIRGGVFFPLNESGTELGWSMGYLKGPDGSIDITHRLSSVSAETMTGSLETRYIRILNEVRQRVPINRHIEMRIRGAVGATQGSMKGTTTHTSIYMYTSSLGLPTPFVRSHTETETWVGFTADISPSIAWTTKYFVLDVGVSYVWLPGHDAATDSVAFDWSPFGLRVGLEF